MPPLRANLSGNPGFTELLARTREVALGAYAHQDVPFGLLVDESQPKRDLGNTPLFQAVFTLQNAPSSILELPGVANQPQITSTATFSIILARACYMKGNVKRKFFS
jgi:non-ribosomal peptide synthetase component F